MLHNIGWWRKELASWFIPFFKKPPTKPAAKLCTVTFLYDVKGIIGAGKNKRDTVFAWVADASTSHDCVVLFNPPGIGKGKCTIKEITVLPIPTVEPKHRSDEQ